MCFDGWLLEVGVLMPVPTNRHARHECRLKTPEVLSKPSSPRRPHRRCLICELPTLVVANQMLWSAHPANPLKAAAHFHLGKRKPAETRIHEAWQLFQQR